ncbi:MAG: potassium channel family protein [Burkholderiales bacterium]
MQKELRHLLGMAGVPAHDNPAAHVWERRLQWIMVLAALLAIPSFYLEGIATSSRLNLLGGELDMLILAIFSGELLWMLYLSHHKWLYLRTNWLNLLIILGAAVSVVGWDVEWLPLVRLLRVTYIALIVARLMGSLRRLFSPNAIPYVLMLGLITLGVSGGVFYLIEPTVHSYADGLWLAFTSGATVGYGDIVPTTPLSRFFAVIMVLVGFAVLSLVTASIAALFVGEDEKVLRREMHRDIRLLREEVAALRQELGLRGETARPAQDGAELPDNQP